jgi:hypothetical protein
MLQSHSVTECELIRRWNNKMTLTWVDWLWWGETDVPEPQPSLVYCSSPGWMWVESHGVMMPAGYNAWLVYQSSLAVLPAETFGASKKNGRRNHNFAYSVSFCYVNGSLTCRKILRHGNSGFTSHQKEGVLRIFITLKNPSPRPIWTRDPWVQWLEHYTTEATLKWVAHSDTAHSRQTWLCQLNIVRADSGHSGEYRS